MSKHPKSLKPISIKDLAECERILKELQQEQEKIIAESLEAREKASKFKKGEVVVWEGSVGKDACVVVSGRHPSYDVLVSNGNVHLAWGEDLSYCDDLKEVLKRQAQYREYKKL